MREIFAKAVLPLLALGAFLWLRGEQRQDTKELARQELLATCEDDAGCRRVVERWFPLCFTNAWSGGTRRVASDFDADAVRACLEQHAGRTLFAAARR